MSKEKETARAYLEKEKWSAAYLTRFDLGDWINFSNISREYFKKSNNWILQRLHGYDVGGKKAQFRENEYVVLSNAYREIAKKLLDAANLIDNAKLVDANSNDEDGE